MHNALETGCYIDSHHGHYAVPQVIQLAHSMGYIVDPFVEFALELYDELNHDERYPQEALMEESDRAIDWLNSSPTEREVSGQNMPPARPENAYWAWNDGDFGLYVEEDMD